MSACSVSMRSGWSTAVLLQPFKFLANFNLAVPWIFRKRMAFAGKDQQCTGDTQVVKSMVEQIIFCHSDTNIVRSPHDVGSSANFVDLEDCRFVVITLLRLPGKAAEEVSIVEGSIVIAPIGDMLH